MKKVAVVGGGASGMMAAVQAAQNGAQVSLFERNDRVGKKILMTGNGKCNFSNRDLKREDYNGSGRDRLPDIFRQFSAEDTVAFFERAGMAVKEKNGYLYPLSGQASTVLDILRLELRRLSVDIRLQTMIEKIGRDEERKGFFLRTGGKNEVFDSVVIACGGAAAPKTGSDGSGYALAASLGHPVTECVPALVQLRCGDDFFRALAGVRCEAFLQLLDGEKAVQEEWGELQFTEYGVSGIPVFQQSRRAAFLLRQKKKPRIRIDFFPEYDDRAYEKLCRGRMERREGKTVEEFLLGMANKKINMVLIRQAGLRPQEEALQVEERRLEALLASFRDFSVHVTGTNSFDQAQVTAGGVDMRGVSSSMESLLIPGLFFAGEVLDVDGRCGGYNLQWAWTSGWIAGKNAALT